MLLLAGAASLLAGCGASDPDEGVTAFRPVEHVTLPQEAWIASLGTLFHQGDVGPENAWRMQVGPPADLEHSGTPYVVEQVVPKA